MKIPSHTPKQLLVPFLLPLLGGLATDLQATLLFNEDFETDGEGTRYISTGLFTDGADDYFTRVTGTDNPAGLPAFTGYSGSAFWAAEDIDSNDNPDGLALLDFTGINLAGFSQVTISLELGAGSTSSFDSADDFLNVHYRFDGGTWQTALSFQNDGTRFNTGLHLDEDMDGIGDGPAIGLNLDSFTSAAITPSSDLMDIRIDTFMTGNAEAVAFDNLRVTAVPEPRMSVLALTAAALIALAGRKPFLPHRENESQT